MHNEGIASQRAVTAFNDFSPVSAAHILRTKETIAHFPLVFGQAVKVSLRGVIGFCDIILRLMVTIDAEISGPKMAEAAALEQLNELPHPRIALSASSFKNTKKINGVCAASYLPKPQDETAVKDSFLRNRIIFK